MTTDDDIQRQWQKIHKISLAHLKDGGYVFALTSPSNAGPPPNKVVSVKDTGAGIDYEILPRLFTKFANKSFAGTGLGLYISKNIVEAHGGRIWAENNPDGKGATFSFSLPIFKT